MAVSAGITELPRERRHVLPREHRSSPLGQPISEARVLTGSLSANSLGERCHRGEETLTGSRTHTDTESRAIEIETDRVLGRHEEHIGVIDVGSNSIRLVVYDDLSRAPFPRFNEKSLIALGNGLDDDGRFTEHAMSEALHTIRRFASIARAMGVRRVDVLATEATRRAKILKEVADAKLSAIQRSRKFSRSYRW